MNISTTFKFSVALTSIALLLEACEKHDGIIEAGPANSADYYFAHPAEAKQAAERCVTFERNEYSQMGSSKQQAWQETTAGINCQNSKHAYSLMLIQARQRELIESDKKMMSQ